VLILTHVNKKLLGAQPSIVDLCPNRKSPHILWVPRAKTSLIAMVLPVSSIPFLFLVVPTELGPHLDSRLRGNDDVGQGGWHGWLLRNKKPACLLQLTNTKRVLVVKSHRWHGCKSV